MFYIIGEHFDGNTYLLGGYEDRNQAVTKKQHVERTYSKFYRRVSITVNVMPER